MRRSQSRLSSHRPDSSARAGLELLDLSPWVRAVSVIRRSSLCMHYLYTHTLLTVIGTDVSQCLTLLLGSIPWYQEPPTQFCSGDPLKDTHLYRATSNLKHVCSDPRVSCSPSGVTRPTRRHHRCSGAQTSRSHLTEHGAPGCHTARHRMASLLFLSSSVASLSPSVAPRALPRRRTARHASHTSQRHLTRAASHPGSGADRR